MLHGDGKGQSTMISNKIDIHSHILPGIDDGAENIEEALKMLRCAAQEGITQMIATPHFHYRRGHASAEKVRETLDKLQSAANREKLPIKLYAGNELYYTHELLEQVKEGRVLTLAESDYILLEFSTASEPRKIQNAVYEFLSEGYSPVIAHIERYQAFLENTEFAEEIAKMGAYYQLNASSLTETFGWRLKKFAKHMLQEGLVQFVATDAHDSSLRKPAYGKAEEWLVKKIGKTETQKLFVENPEKILQNEII